MDSSEPGDLSKASLKDLSGQSELTLNELKDLLGVTYQTALRYVKNGNIKAIRRGGSWRITESEIRRFLESGNNGMQDPTSQKASDHYRNTRDKPPRGFKMSDLE